MTKPTYKRMTAAKWDAMSTAEREQWESTMDKLPQGTKVECNGYRGVIVRHYDKEMYEIRVPGGVVCTDAWKLIQ